MVRGPCDLHSFQKPVVYPNSAQGSVPVTKYTRLSRATHTLHGIKENVSRIMWKSSEPIKYRLQCNLPFFQFRPWMSINGPKQGLFYRENLWKSVSSVHVVLTRWLGVKLNPHFLGDWCFAVNIFLKWPPVRTTNTMVKISIWTNYNMNAIMFFCGPKIGALCRR